MELATAAAATGGLLSLLGGLQAQHSAKREAQKNRDFQERMSNTAHQREVSDLRAAGLNPILSGTGGAGAATSAGSMANIQDAVTPAVSTALETRRNDQELENLKQTENTSASQEVMQDMQAHKTKMDAEVSEETKKKVMQETKLLTEQTNSAKSFSGMQMNELYSSNIDRRINELNLESERRIVERYGGTAKGLIPFGSIFDKWKTPKTKK